MSEAKKLKSNEIEAANRAEATARLIRLGYKVYRPESDSDGEDLVLLTPKKELRSVQLKGRPTVDQKKYGGDKRIWMLFPDPKGDWVSGRDWFLVPHKEFYAWLEAKHGHTDSMKNKGGWSENYISPEMSAFLRKYLLPTQTTDSFR
jgi:hypothetical protein